MDKRTTTDTIVIHCTQTPPNMDVDVDKVTEWHKDRGFDTIGYHYLIKRDGTLQVGRDEDAVGAHAVAVNGTSIGVALAGGGTSSMGWENNFTPVQFETLKSIILKLKDKYNIEKIIGHYQVDDGKECPSFNVPGWLEKNGLV
jgi:N-acetylmuramoyl-L-alanine amidase